MPVDHGATYDGYYNTIPECWSVYTEVLAEEYSNAVLYGQVHQLTVDAYAVQHAGGEHPDKSVGIHLSGLYLMLEKDVASADVPPLHQMLAEAVAPWPIFNPPSALDEEALTVFDVAMADTPEQHAAQCRTWACQTWARWRRHHERVENLVAKHLSDPVYGSESPPEM